MKEPSKWSGKLGIERDPFDSPRMWVVNEALTFYSSNHNVEVNILPGFVTDGASVPRVFWWYASPFSGLHAPAALIHDGLYAVQLTTRKGADKLFLEAMISLGVRTTKAHAMYSSVEHFGWSSWSDKNEEQLKHAKDFVKVWRMIK